MNDNIRVFEEKHMIAIMLYLLDHDGCKKTELYEATTRNPRMPLKLLTLASYGLLELEQSSHCEHIHLTEKGWDVARKLENIAETMN